MRHTWVRSGFAKSATSGMGMLVMVAVACSVDETDYHFTAGGQTGQGSSGAGASHVAQGGTRPSSGGASAGGVGGTAAGASGGNDIFGGSGGQGPTPELICAPAEAVCNGDRATVCNAEGTGYDGAGVKCSSKHTCVAGACEAHECIPRMRYCAGDAVLQCAENGLSSAEVAKCRADQYCDEATAACKLGNASGGAGGAGGVGVGGAGGVGAGGAGGVPGAGGAGGVPGAAGAGPIPVRFAEVRTILTGSCATGTCHMPGGMHINLTDDAMLYARLTSPLTVGAMNCMGRTLVVGGNPAMSLLYTITGATPPCAARRMPNNCGTAGNPACLTDAQRQTIAAWITAGAPM